MNEEAFLVDLLDMIKISPVTDSTDGDVKLMQNKLDIVEAMIRDRLPGWPPGNIQPACPQQAGPEATIPSSLVADQPLPRQLMPYFKSISE